MRTFRTFLHRLTTRQPSGVERYCGSCGEAITVSPCVYCGN